MSLPDPPSERKDLFPQVPGSSAGRKPSGVSFLQNRHGWKESSQLRSPPPSKAACIQSMTDGFWVMKASLTLLPRPGTTLMGYSSFRCPQGTFIDATSWPSFSLDLIPISIPRQFVQDNVYASGFAPTLPLATKAEALGKTRVLLRVGEKSNQDSEICHVTEIFRHQIARTAPPT